MRPFSLPSLSCALLCSGLLLSTQVHAQSGPGNGLPPGMGAQMVQMAANLNHAAVSCGTVTAAAVESKRQTQRTEAPKTFQMSVAEYDRLYEQAGKDFQKRWGSLSAAQKQQTCTELKKMRSAQ